MNQFKVQGLEANGQATPTSRITIIINKDVHANFGNETTLLFTINDELLEAI